MQVNLCIAYRPLRLAVLHGTTIIYTRLSEQYQQMTGDWIDPHTGWSWQLAQIDFRCVGLCRPGHRPILSALVITDPGGRSNNPARPGEGFWGLRNPRGLLITPVEPSDEAWIEMCQAVYWQEWPENFADLPVG